VLVCPQAYRAWKGENSFSGGYQGLCSYYTTLNEEEKATFKAANLFNDTGFITNRADWEREFTSKHWTNGKEWSYIVK